MNMTLGYDHCHSGMCGHQSIDRGTCMSCEEIKNIGGCDSYGAVLQDETGAWTEPCKMICEKLQGPSCGFKDETMDVNMGYDDCTNGICGHQQKHRGTCMSCEEIMVYQGCEVFSKRMNFTDAWTDPCIERC